MLCNLPFYKIFFSSKVLGISFFNKKGSGQCKCQLSPVKMRVLWRAISGSLLGWRDQYPDHCDHLKVRTFAKPRGFGWREAQACPRLSNRSSGSPLLSSCELFMYWRKSSDLVDTRAWEPGVWEPSLRGIPPWWAVARISTIPKSWRQQPQTLLGRYSCYKGSRGNNTCAGALYLSRPELMQRLRHLRNPIHIGEEPNFKAF